MGWDVTGIDFDIKAVKAAKRKGIDVRHGGIEILNSKEERFDYITMAHILEHVHDPGGFFTTQLYLLNKIKLWIDTPNNNSKFMEKNCVVLKYLDTYNFSHKFHRRHIKKIGFKSFYYPPYRKLCKSLFYASHVYKIQ